MIGVASVCARVYDYAYRMGCGVAGSPCSGVPVRVEFVSWDAEINALDRLAGQLPANQAPIGCRLPAGSWSPSEQVAIPRHNARQSLTIDR